MNDEQKTLCPKCGHPLKFKVGSPKYMSLPHATVVVVEHLPAHCKECGRDWTLKIEVPGAVCTGLIEIPPASLIDVAGPGTKLPPPPGSLQN